MIKPVTDKRIDDAIAQHKLDKVADLLRDVKAERAAMEALLKETLPKLAIDVETNRKQADRYVAALFRAATALREPFQLDGERILSALRILEKVLQPVELDGYNLWETAHHDHPEHAVVHAKIKELDP